MVGLVESINKFNQPLDRRAQTHENGLKPSYPSASRLVKAAQFKQVLTKYVRRQARFGRTFCLASLQILEYEHTRQHMGEQAAEQLHRLGCDMFLQNIRAADKLCVACPGKFLLLLCDTDYQSASKILTRLTQLIAQAKIHYHRKALRASCLVYIVDSAEQGGDLESLLASVGLQLDDKRDFCWIGMQDQLSPTHAPGHVTVCGDFTSWQERYCEMSQVAERTLARHLKLTEMIASDSWRGKQVVHIRLVEPADDEAFFDDDVLQIILARAKVLQSVDHPGVVGLRDYHLKSSRALYLVQDNLLGQSFKTYVAGVDVDVALVLDWGEQVLNSIIYLQGLVPPVVPQSFGDDMFIVAPHQHLILTDYELPYLFPRWYQVAHMSDDDIEAIAQGRPTATYVPVIRSFAKSMTRLLARTSTPPEGLVTFFSRLDTTNLPLELNTVFKVRAALKATSDVIRVDITARG